MRSRFTKLTLACSLLAPVWIGCQESTSDEEYVARLGSMYLQEEDVVSALASMPPGLDSVHAAEQFIDRWVTDELLLEEARRRSLGQDPEVQRRLAENERSVLISSLIDRLYDEVEPATEREIASYFERNADNLLLREPFLRVWYFASRDSVLVSEAMALIDSVDIPSAPDSVWLEFLARTGQSESSSTIMSANYYPVSRLFRNQPYLQSAVSTLRPGESTLVLAEDSVLHVIVVADRVEAGTRPKVEWIIELIQNRLLIEKRKQMYVDQVQRLRNRALAEGRLEVRE